MLIRADNSTIRSSYLYCHDRRPDHATEYLRGNDTARLPQKAGRLQLFRQHDLTCPGRGFFIPSHCLSRKP